MSTERHEYQIRVSFTTDKLLTDAELIVYESRMAAHISNPLPVYVGEEDTFSIVEWHSSRRRHSGNVLLDLRVSKGSHA